MNQRSDRWYLLVELAALIEPYHPRLAQLPRAARRKYVWRLLRNLERRDRTRYSKRVGRALHVSYRAIESLMPSGQRPLTDLEEDIARLAQEQKALKKQANGHGSRLAILERKQAITQRYLRDMNAVDRDTIGS